MRCTNLLSMLQTRIEQPAPGIGVDLDQLRPGIAQMEVKAQKGPGGRRCMPGDRRGMRQHPRLPSWQGRDALHHFDQACHGLQMRSSRIHQRVENRCGRAASSSPICLPPVASKRFS